MEKIIRKTAKDMKTSGEALTASRTPSSNLWMLGMKRNILNDLNSLNERKANIVLVAIDWSRKGLAIDGKATISTTKSNRFQPELQ